MSYPSIEKYTEALQAPERNLLDAALRRGVVRKNGLNMPLALCGGFALTYSLTVDGKRFAVRCFHKESAELERRYQAVAARLRQLSPTYFLQFDFLSPGIRIDGATYPVVKMAWAEGETLSEFLEREHVNPVVVGQLRTALAGLCTYLESEGIAHGDIQPGNVMVSDKGNAVKLIDYDGMFVPALRGLRATESGQRNFQHPGRPASNFDEKLDRFSFIALDVALHALMTDPGLWRRSRSEPEAVVFRAQDHANPGSSGVYADLLRLPAVREVATRLAQIAASPMAQVPSLADFRAGRNIPSDAAPFAPRAVGAPRGYQSAYDVLNGANYAAFLRRVGDKIELVGKVHSFKRGYGRNRKPYYFVNFSNWLETVSIVIWSDAFAVVDELPTDAWVGRWLSMTAFVGPPYPGKTKKGVSYTNIALSLDQRGQMQVLTEEDAAFRLKGGPAPQTPPGPARGTNADVLDRMAGRNGRPQIHVVPPAPRPAPAPPPAPLSSNQAVIDRMRRATAAPPSPAAARRSPAPAPSSTRAPAPASSGYRPVPPRKDTNWAVWAAVLIVAFFVLKSCLH